MESKEIFDGRYVVYSDGRIWSTYRKKFMIPDINYKGYETIRIYINKIITKHTTIHRLVAESFIPNPNNFTQINHINGDKTNNRVENLEWCSNRGNQRHFQNFFKNNQYVGTTKHHRKFVSQVTINRKISILVFMILKKKLTGFISNIVLFIIYFKYFSRTY